jgi:hypothetical protein
LLHDEGHMAGKTGNGIEMNASSLMMRTDPNQAIQLLICILRLCGNPDKALANRP